MSFYVYILRCMDDSFYVGHTDDLEARLAAHTTGTYGGYTKSRRPLKLVFSEMFQTRDEALRAERQIKGWSRAKKAALIRGDWVSLRHLAYRYASTTPRLRPPGRRQAGPGSPPEMRRPLVPNPRSFVLREPQDERATARPPQLP